MTFPTPMQQELNTDHGEGSQNIGEAAKASGVSAKMIRHYESIGLISAARRTDGGYRMYGPQDVRTLQFIRRGRELGFSLDQIRELLALWQNQGRVSKEVRALAGQHVADLDRRIMELQAMRRSLEPLVVACHGDDRPDCPILDDLSLLHADSTRPGRYRWQ